MARQTARITHSHELGIEGAALQACAVALLLDAEQGDELAAGQFLAALRGHVHSAPFRAALEAIERLIPTGTPESIAREIGNDITAQSAVPAALCCFLQTPDSFSQTVLKAIALGGDTDTIASMAGALAGGYLGEAAIPEVWALHVEGRGQLWQLAEALHSQAANHLLALKQATRGRQKDVFGPTGSQRTAVPVGLSARPLSQFRLCVLHRSGSF